MGLRVRVVGFGIWVCAPHPAVFACSFRPPTQSYTRFGFKFCCMCGLIKLQAPTLSFTRASKVRIRIEDLGLFGWPHTPTG